MLAGTYRPISVYLLDLEALQKQFCSCLHLESLNLPCLRKKVKKKKKIESYIVTRGKFASHNRTSKNKILPIDNAKRKKVGSEPLHFTD